MAIQPFNYQKRTNIEEHNQIVDKLNEVVDAVNNIDPNPSEFEQRIDALEQSAINQQNAIDGIHTRDALQDTEISTIKGKVTVNTNNIDQLNGRVDDTVNIINDVQTTLNNDINDLGGRVNTLGDTVATVTGQVGQLETDTTNLDGRVTDLDGRVTTLAGNYTTLGGRVDSLNTEVGQLSTQVGGLETGKVNADQGVANAGKVLGIGADGQVTPVEQSGGGGSNLPFTASDVLPVPPSSYIIMAKCREVNEPIEITLTACNLQTKTATASVRNRKRSKFVLLSEKEGNPVKYQSIVHHFALSSTVIEENTQETKPYSISGTIILAPTMFNNTNEIHTHPSAIIESCTVDGMDVTPSFSLDDKTTIIEKAVYISI